MSDTANVIDNLINITVRLETELFNLKADRNTASQKKIYELTGQITKLLYIINETLVPRAPASPLSSHRNLFPELARAAKPTF